MGLEERLMGDLKEAMRKGDVARRSVIRLARAAIKNAEIERGRPLKEDEIMAVLAKEATKRRESIVEFGKGGRKDLVEKEEAELVILLSYLPQQLSREEIVAAASKVIQEVGAKGPAEMGKVMPRLIAELRGRAEGREISAVVAQLLRQP